MSRDDGSNRSQCRYRDKGSASGINIGDRGIVKKLYLSKLQPICPKNATYLSKSSSNTHKQANKIPKNVEGYAADTEEGYIWGAKISKM